MESTTGYTFTPYRCGIFYFPWHRHQIEGTNGFYCLIRKTERFTISNVESQVFTPNNSRLPRGLNAGGPRPKRVSYHWTTAPLSKLCARWNHTCRFRIDTPLRGSSPMDPLSQLELSNFAIMPSNCFLIMSLFNANMPLSARFRFISIFCCYVARNNHPF